MSILRIKKVIHKMKSEKVEQLIVSDPSTIFYLTGKHISPGERMVALYLNANGEIKLILNKLFPMESSEFDILWYSDDDNPIKVLGGIIDKSSKLGIDKVWPARFLIEFMDLNKDIQVFNGSKLIDELRMCKDIEEIEIMKESSKINDVVMEKLIAKLEEGRTEKYYCNLLQELYEEEGVTQMSFSPIIAFSPNGADPHHKSGNTTLKSGDSIIIDIGGVYKGYCSDMTRTIFFGKGPIERHKKIYNIVKDANLKAIEKVKPGAKFSDIDKAAREYITESGYGEYFTHRTGHSIGIDCHEFGDVSGVNNDTLKEGMIFSVEPGIYLKGDIGVRIEDLVLVAKDGYEVLNSVSKEIRVV